MSPYRFPFAIFGFFTFVAVVPAWLWFLRSHPSEANLPIEVQFLASMVLPATLLLFIGSWLQPGGAT